MTFFSKEHLFNCHTSTSKSVQNKLKDGWIPFSCSSFRALVLFLLVLSAHLFALALTSSLHLEFIWQQFILPVAEGEGQESEEEGVQDADDGQDVGPAHGAVPQAVLIRSLATHSLHLRRVPAVWVDHAAHHHQRGCGGRKVIEMAEPCNNYPLCALTLINNY